MDARQIRVDPDFLPRMQCSKSKSEFGRILSFFELGGFGSGSGSGMMCPGRVCVETGFELF